MKRDELVALISGSREELYGDIRSVINFLRENFRISDVHEGYMNIDGIPGDLFTAQVECDDGPLDIKWSYEYSFIKFNGERIDR